MSQATKKAVAAPRYQLKAVEYKNSAEDFNYESGGTFAKFAKGCTVRFSKKNLASNKRIALILSKEGQDDMILPCSSPLSSIIREGLKTYSKSQIIGSLRSLDVMFDIDDPTKYFLMQPKGEMDEGTLFEDAVADDVVDYSELAGAF